MVLWRRAFDNFDRHLACGGILFLSDSDDQDDRAVTWMRQYGRKDRFERREPHPIRGDSLLDVAKCAARLAVKGKYGNWDDYLRFLHVHHNKEHKAHAQLLANS
mgnify:CR=1 FL=1